MLTRITLRLMEEAERERFDHLLEAEHYLKSSRLGGRHLRYVAEADGRWIAILTFSGAAPHLKAREKWLGWSARQRARRLEGVMNFGRAFAGEDFGDSQGTSDGPVCHSHWSSE